MKRSVVESVMFRVRLTLSLLPTICVAGVVLKSCPVIDCHNCHITRVPVPAGAHPPGAPPPGVGRRGGRPG
jgi:hypothetical protein